MKIFMDESTQSIVKQRGICHLIHFTDVENLESILMNGLCSVSNLCKNDMIYKFTDSSRRDGRIDCVSYSIEFPNYMYLKSLIQKTGNKYVILRLNVECVFNRTIYIHKSNPYLPRWGGAQLFEDLFFEEYRCHSLPSKFPTDPRAEIQYGGVVQPKDIEGIFYPSNFPSHSANYLNELIEKYSNFNIVKDDYYFGERMDSKHWIDIRKRGLDVYEAL